MRANSHKLRPGEMVGIIGSGVAGLQMARALKARGIACTVFEKAAGISGLWWENYCSYAVQTPAQLYEFPDFPHRGRRRCLDAFGDVTAQHYMPGAKVQAYIESYAKHFELESCVVLNTKVFRLARRANGKRGWIFHLSSEGAALPPREFDYAIVASGMYSAPPNMPQLDGLATFEASGGKVLHSSQYTDQSVAAGKKVLVIGGCKSAIDIAVDSSAVSDSTTMLYRRAHWATPRLMFWFIPFQYIFYSRLGQLLVSIYKGAFPGARAYVGWLHRCLSRLVHYVFRLVEEAVALQLGQYGDYRPADDIVRDFYGYAHILSYAFKDAKASGKLAAQRGQVVRLVANGVVVTSPCTAGCRGGAPPQDPSACKALSEEYTVPCDLVLCGTGFKKTYAYLPETERAALGVEADGLYLYRHIFPPSVPDLAFCGSEVATVSNILTHALHAEYITRVLSGDLKLPSPKLMAAEIAEMKAWKRSWMPETSSRAALVMLHQTHYHDVLLKDMGLAPGRKNCLAELVMPYQPGDYDGIIGSGANDGKVSVGSKSD